VITALPERREAPLGTTRLLVSGSPRHDDPDDDRGDHDGDDQRNEEIEVHRRKPKYPELKKNKRWILKRVSSFAYRVMKSTKGGHANERQTIGSGDPILGH
jgi:hypothetical protein